MKPKCITTHDQIIHLLYIHIFFSFLLQQCVFVLPISRWILVKRKQRSCHSNSPLPPRPPTTAQLALYSGQRWDSECVCVESIYNSFYNVCDWIWTETVGSGEKQTVQELLLILCQLICKHLYILSRGIVLPCCKHRFFNRFSLVITLFGSTTFF